MLRLDFWNLAITVINLIVLFLLMKKFLIGPVMNVIEKRENLIKDELKNAKDTEQASLELKKEYEDSLKSAGVKKNEIIQSAKTKAEAEYNRIIKDANDKAGKIISDAEKTISMEREKILREMQSDIARLAILAANKVIGENTSQNSNLSLYDNFLKETGDSNDTNSN